jgi:hypothetical protein
MATIKITDQLGATVDAQLGSTSAWLKYARGAADMLLAGTPISQLQTLKLSEPSIRSLNAGLAFKEPVSLGSGVPPLNIGANAGISFRLVQGAVEDEAPPDGTCYAALGFNAKVSVGASTGGEFTFGINAGGGMAIESFRAFPSGGEGPPVLDVLRTCVGEFIIPVSSDDLDAMAPGAVVTIKGDGSLKFSAKANLLAVANPLAAATLPSPLPALSVNGTANVTVGAAYAISSGYEVRAHKVAPGKARLAWHRKKDSDFEVSVSASAGLGAEVAGTDLFPQVIKAISADSKADLSGLPDDQRREAEKAVTAAVNRNLQAALEAELGSLHSEDAMFLYEVDCAALDAAAKAAVGRALAGDLSGMAQASGVTEIRSMQSKMSERQFTWKINLLGIFNFGSVSRLALESKVTFTASTGDLVIVDRATASRIQTASSNFGADEDKLHSLMAESFLITAAYRGSKAVLAPPELNSCHVFYRLYGKTRRADLQSAAAIAAALGLNGPEIPAGSDDFGRACLLAETRYDDARSHALFLRPDGAPRSHAEYEAAGRKAIRLLVLPTGDDSFRLKPATDDALWGQMTKLGPPSFRQLFPPVQAEVIGADYLAIQWWADTMCKTGAVLAQIAKKPELREQLASDLRDVAGKSHEQFGKPWGMVAMFLAGGSAAPAELSITGKQIKFAAGAALAAGAPGD